MAEVRVGTSGFAYKEWKPAFYPADLPQSRFLQYYASQFRSVEIDSTFYRMPNQATLDRWREASHPGFRFALKASRRITHWERLRLPSGALDYLTGALPRLEDRLGVVLFQLPPNFPSDAERLALFLDSLPPGMTSAFEFRHDSWFSGDVYALLETHGAALVIHDADDHATPVEVTGTTTYLRLRKTRYTAKERAGWRRRFRAWQGAGIDVYAFIKHEDNPDAPRIAREFAEGFQEAGVREPL